MTGAGRGPRRATARIAAALLAAAVAPAALAYILPTGAILRGMAAKRAEAGIVSLEATGLLEASGPTAERVAQAAGLRTLGGRVAVTARFSLKVPGRCRIELVPAGLAEADRPFATVRDGALAGRGLETSPAVAALLRSTCALLAVAPVAGGSAAYAEALGRRGVALGAASLGRFGGRITYVLGGRPSDPKPLVFVDKETLRPLRLLASEGGPLLDTRLVGWGSPVGGDWFPRAVEVHERDALLLRFSAEKVVANPKLPDAIF
ncbi:MAG TPA: hypothetical protein VLS93_18145 [Anaeromyxobacteraceae bacterium]|nr:hypothetical protein [Anaeromyxobacteraceae bacterium]